MYYIFVFYYIFAYFIFLKRNKGILCEKAFSRLVDPTMDQPCLSIHGSISNSGHARLTVSNQHVTATGNK